ncbi:MAG: DUF2207 domain-containing protein [Oscillospiraceae bacterium]
MINKKTPSACLRLLVCILLICALIVPGAVCFAEVDNGYYIKNYDVNAVANSDRSYDIVETIDVHFNEERHGIIREIPTYSTLEKEIRLENVEVVGDIFEYDGYEKIKIGDPNETVSGDKRYTIKYTLAHWADTAPDFDYLYLNLIGTEWNTRIESFSATVRLPDGAEVNSCTVTGGSYGDDGKTVAEFKQEGDTITVTGKRGLDAYEGATINVEMNEGAFFDAEVWMPALVFENVKSDMVMDEYGIMTVNQTYDVTVNRGEYYMMYLMGYTGDTGSKLNSVELVLPGGSRQTEKNENVMINLNGYEGRRVSFKVAFEKAYNVSEGKSSLQLEQMIFGGNSEYEIKNFESSITMPFEIGSLSPTRTIYSFDPVEGVKVSIDKNTGTIHSEPAQMSAERDVYVNLEMPETEFLRRGTAFDIIVPIFGALVLCVIAFFALTKRDRKLNPVPEFYPPDGMNPAEMGYAIDAHADAKDMTSLIYYWASKKLLKIEIQDENSFTFRKLAEMGQGFMPYERKMFNGLWAGDATSVTNKELEEKYYKHINAALAEIRGQKKGKDGYIDGGRSAASWTAGCLTPILCVALAFAAAISRGFPFAGEVFALMLVLVLCFTISISVSGLMRKRYKSNSAVGRIFSGIWLAIRALIIVVLVSATLGSRVLAMPSAVFTGLCIALISAVAPLIQRRTEFGSDSLEKALGFKQFLMTAEKERLKMLLDENPDYYYDILPYAQVLGVSDQWSHRFDGLMLEEPSWAEGSHSTMSTAMMLNSLNGSMGRSLTSMPSSSGGSGIGGGGGFSGGGFSGGGSGGGGGSSW